MTATSRRSLAALLAPASRSIDDDMNHPGDALACLLGARAAITVAINRLQPREEIEEAPRRRARTPHGRAEGMA